MRIGIYGGSFDPIHIAHLLLAETAMEQLALDRVHFVLANQSPLKTQSAASPNDRKEMLHLATCGNDKFVVDDRELNRPGVSYTVDTLQDIHSEFPDAKLFLIMGADALNDLPRWKSPGEICQLAQIAVSYRAGHSMPDFSVLGRFASEEYMAQAISNSIQMPQLDISSTEIRERIAKQGSIRYRVPAAVAAFIHQHGIYQVSP